MMHKMIIQFINIEIEPTKIENSTPSFNFHRLEDFTFIRWHLSSSTDLFCTALNT